MKNIKSIYLIAIFLFAANSHIYSSAKEVQENTKSFKVDKGGQLVVNVSPGEINVSVWDKNEVFIKVIGLDEDDLKSVKMNKSGNTVTIKYGGEWGWSDDAEYYFTIPKEFSLDLKTSGGNITLKDDIKGEVEMSTAGGNVKLKSVIGNVKVSTSGGEITTGNVNGRLYLSTMGGNIRVGTITGGEAKVSTMGGNIQVDGADSNLEVKTYGGNIRIGNIGGDASVTTFGGNISLDKVSGSAEMSTYGGNLYLKGATGKVKAKTMGGNISLKDVTGSINASTAAGDVYVELNPSGGGSSSLTTSAGELELCIPATAKATIEARIIIHGWWQSDKESYKIISDFKSKTYVKDKDEEEIRATYELNGGGDLIELRTVNSDIKIKKLSK